MGYECPRCHAIPFTCHPFEPDEAEQPKDRKASPCVAMPMSGTPLKCDECGHTLTGWVTLAGER